MYSDSFVSVGEFGREGFGIRRTYYIHAYVLCLMFPMFPLHFYLTPVTTVQLLVERLSNQLIDQFILFPRQHLNYVLASKSPTRNGFSLSFGLMSCHSNLVSFRIYINRCLHIGSLDYADQEQEMVPRSQDTPRLIRGEIGYILFH